MYRPDVSDGQYGGVPEGGRAARGKDHRARQHSDDDARAVGIREIFATDYTLHSRTGDVMGCDAYIERIAANLRTFSGMHFIIDDLVVQVVRSA